MMLDTLDRMELLLLELIARTRRELEAQQTAIEPDIAEIICADRSSLYSSDFDAPPLPSKENQE